MSICFHWGLTPEGKESLAPLLVTSAKCGPTLGQIATNPHRRGPVASAPEPGTTRQAFSKKLQGVPEKNTSEQRNNPHQAQT